MMEEEGIDTPEALKAHIPICAVDHGVLYVDGIPTEKWQLSAEEIQKWFPEEWAKDHPQTEIPCPIPECKSTLNWTGNKATYIQHCRHKHPDWFDRARKSIDLDDLKRLVEEAKKQE